MPKPSKPTLREFELHNRGAPKCKLADYKVSKYKVVPAGDTALSVELGDCIDRTVSAAVLALARRLNEKRLNGVIEAVPTLRSLMICYDPLVLPPSSLVAYIDEMMTELETCEPAGRSWSLPVCYDRRFAPDLDAWRDALVLRPPKSSSAIAHLLITSTCSVSCRAR